jgi:hypothetical protein
MIDHPMTQPLRRHQTSPEAQLAPATPAETASYIKDLLGSLLEMAECQQQRRLAELLELAQKEAESLGRRLARA